jgi:5-formyltetrahydrofolate cyclo-ligase
MSIADEKKIIRTEIRSMKGLLRAEEKAAATAKALEKLEQQDFFITAQTVLLYWSLPDEVPTQAFAEKWAMEKIILLPAIVGDKLEARLFTSKQDMETGSFGIVQPIGEAFTGKIDLAIIPGLAFDKNGYRVGRGKGFYDRFLADFSGIKCGLCYDFQLLEQVPHEGFDIPMNVIVTENEVIQV